MNDELLGAYLDGELDSEARRKLARDLGENFGANLRLKRMKQADNLLREAIPPLPAAADDTLARRILQSAPVRRFAWVAPLRAYAPLAAALALAVLAGRMSAPAPAPETGGAASMRIEASLADALDRNLSGETAPILGGEAQMALSLRAEDGALCRQFRLTSGPHISDALACREEGAWRMLVQVAAAQAAAGYSTAGEGAGSALDAAIESLGVVTVLDESEEREAIASAWRTN